MIWQPEFTDKTLSRKPGAVQLGSVTIIIGLGAMLGRMIEHSGGAESLANYFSRKLGDKRTIAALTLAAFFLGIPVFFDVGFIILAPIAYFHERRSLNNFHRDRVITFEQIAE
ncbi:hypothetical protein BU69_01685 [Escherichia coli]|nr:hypothetical protein BU69_01685 [Escherichia coli]KEP09555.1 hypothetical protein EH62_07235 [Escherichia coli]